MGSLPSMLASMVRLGWKRCFHGTIGQVVSIGSDSGGDAPTHASSGGSMPGIGGGGQPWPRSHSFLCCLPRPLPLRQRPWHSWYKTQVVPILHISARKSDDV